MAAFANAAGGLLVLGIAENDAGEGQAIASLESADRDIGLWIHQVVAARIRPTPRVTHRPAAVDQGFVHLIVVEPSVLAPPAVDAGGGALRFPIRTGNTRRLLSEPEVADRYRRRFSDLAARAVKLDELLAEGSAFFPTEAGATDLDPIVVVAALPDFGSQMDLRRGGSRMSGAARQIRRFERFPASGRVGSARCPSASNA